jgi:hypothetical protein
LTKDTLFLWKWAIFFLLGLALEGASEMREKWRGGHVIGQAVLLMVALGLLVYVTMPSAGAEGEVRVELESTTERIVRLEDEAKAKTIESRIRQTAAQLEHERAEQEKTKAMAEQSDTGAIDDKHEAEDDFAKARELASSAVNEQQDARLERQRAESAEKVLSLKTRVASLLKGRAEDEERRAKDAEQELHKVKDRVAAIKEQIAHLLQQARIKRLEADERVSVGQRLLASAKKLSVQARAIQQQHIMDHKISHTISAEALELMKNEARRVARQLQVDSSGLKQAEDLVSSLPSQPDHPLATLEKRMGTTGSQLKKLARKYDHMSPPVYVESSKRNQHKNMQRPPPKHSKGH